MASTIGRISEQIQRIVSGGDPSNTQRVTIPEIRIAIGQVINRLLKMERLVNYQEGERSPVVDAAIAEYDNVAVTTYKDTSSCTLPVIPLHLTRGRGVWHVSKTDSPHDPFIPLQPGQWSLVKNHRLLGEISGITGYEIRGNKLIFTENLPGQGVSEVLIRLLVNDFDSYSDTDILPIPADMEMTVIEEVLKLLGAWQPSDKKVDGVDSK
jgi:hypothetical protein